MVKLLLLEVMVITVLLVHFGLLEIFNSNWLQLNNKIIPTGIIGAANSAISICLSKDATTLAVGCDGR